MRVARVGSTPVKGCHHTAADAIGIDAHGPVGDRDWCLVGTRDEQVLRSITHPELLGVHAASDGTRLDLTLPDGTTARGVPTPAGERATLDYWGRPAPAEMYDGPHAALLSDFLGRPVRLARVDRGAVVYGAPVSLVTTASMADVADRLGRPEVAEQAPRTKSTLVVEADQPYVEDDWLGHEVSIGEAVVRIHARIGRCGLVNRHPDTGAADAPVLKTLAGYRPANHRREPYLAVDAEVLRPGTVRVGDAVRVRDR